MKRPIYIQSGYEGETGYVVIDIISGVTTQGETIEEALKNIKEAVELHFEGEEIDETDLPAPEFFFSTVEVDI